MTASLPLRGYILALAAALASVACGCTSRRPASPAPPSAISAEISRAQIDSVRDRVGTALELIRLVRPSMLVSRETHAVPLRSSGGTPRTDDALDVTVYVDELYVGNLEVLSSIPARSIVAIRRMSLATAPTRYGQGLAAGTIVITTSAAPDRRR